MKKRLLSLLLVCCAAVLLFAALPVTAQAETEGDWEYSVSSGVATVTKYNGTDAVVTIPDTFGLYQVTSIGNSAFEGNVTLTQINFPKGLTSIGEYAFKGCVGLKEVTLPAKLTTLGARSFQNCTWLTKITVECTSLEDMSNNYGTNGQPFYGAGTADDGIAVVFADGCTRVPRRMFYAHGGAASAPNVTSVTIADSVTWVGDQAFMGCIDLQTVNLGNGVDTICNSAFEDCAKLEKVTFSNKLNTINDYAFKNCSALKDVTFPNSLTNIGEFSFEACISLKEVTLPSKLTTLGARSFQNCTQLNKIIVQSTSLNDITNYYGTNGQPFYGAGNAGDGIAVEFADGCTKVPGRMFYATENAVAANITSVKIADSVKEIGGSAFERCVYLTSVDMGNGVTGIGSYAFLECAALDTIDWSDALTSINEHAFDACTSLKTLALPKNLNSIGTCAFKGCTALDDLTFPDALTNIGEYAFENCTSLELVTLPPKLADLGARAFQNCSMINKIIVKSASINTISNYYGTNGQPFYGAGNAGPGITVEFADGCTKVASRMFFATEGAAAANIVSVSLADSVKEIGDAAFENCSFLKKIDFGNGLTTIGGYVFKHCTALEEIKWSDALATIGVYAFESNTALKTADLPKNLNAIHEGAFIRCDALETVTFPNTLTSIGEYAFSDCASIKTVTLPSKLADLGARAFQNCTHINKIVVESEKINNISNYYGSNGQPFYCAGNAGEGIEVVFADGCVRIAPDLFHARSGAAYAPKIISITVADTVTEVGNNAFTNCGELKTLKFLGSNPTIGDNSFGSVVATGYHPGWPEEALLDYGGTITWISEKPVCNHTETTVQNAKAATCTEEGYTGDTVCSACGETLEAGEPIPMTDHTEEIIPAVAPTCKDTGLTEGKKCSVCGETLVKQETVPVTDHTWDEGKITREPTVQQPGERTYTCTVCQTTRTEEVPFSCDHTGSPETKLVNAKEATCTAEGYTGDTVCANCGEVLTKGEAIPAKGHTEEVIPAVAPTCKDTGLTEGKKCAVCGETLVKQEAVPVTDHTWDNGKVTTEATLNKPGVKTFTCTVCGATKTEPVVFNCQHTVNPETKLVNQKDATCAEEGYTGDTVCANCGEILSKGEVIPKTAHTWDEGKITIEATPEHSGEKTYTCTVCGETKTEEVRYVNPDIPPIPELPEEPVEDTAIFRIAGDNRFETAFMVANQMKENLGIEKFNAIIVASGTNFADALSGSYLAAVKQAPILLSYNEEFNDRAKNYIRENLADGGTVYILGGTAAVPESIRDGLEGIEVKRLAGDNRFGTNLAILEEVGVDDKPILVCTGMEFADSLSGSATELPILLVYGNKLLPDQEAFLENLSGNKLYIIGGESAVSKDMQLAVGEYGATKRLGGKNRFETSVLIAEEFFDAPESVVLAYAWNYPDGLCGGALASTMKAPLILTMTKWEAEAKAYAEEAGITDGVVLGGTGLISDDSVRMICGLK